MSTLFLFFVLYHYNISGNFLRLGKSAWDFWGLIFGPGYLLLEAPGMFLGNWFDHPRRLKSGVRPPPLSPWAQGYTCRRIWGKIMKYTLSRLNFHQTRKQININKTNKQHAYLQYINVQERWLCETTLNTSLNLYRKNRMPCPPNLRSGVIYYLLFFFFLASLAREGRKITPDTLI